MQEMKWLCSKCSINHFNYFGVIGINNTSKNLFQKKSQHKSHTKLKKAVAAILLILQEKTLLLLDEEPTIKIMKLLSVYMSDLGWHMFTLKSVCVHEHYGHVQSVPVLAPGNLVTLDQPAKMVQKKSLGRPHVVVGPV